MSGISGVAEGSGWMEKLSRFLRSEAHVEAILVSPEQHKVSVATLGEVDAGRLKAKLEALLKTLDEAHLVTAVAGVGTGRGVMVRRLPDEETLLEKPSCPTAPMLWKWREFAWPEPDEVEDQSREEWQLLALQAGICGVSLVSAWTLGFFEAAPRWAVVFLYLVSLIAGAWDAAQDAWKKVLRGKLDIHFLMLAVAAGAVSIGAWTEGALLLFLFSLSGALEHYALHRTHREINALTKSAPKTANLVRDDDVSEVSVAVDELGEGDLIHVRPDELFPVDAEVTQGSTAADESNLTGEAKPVQKEVGDQVLSGTLNLWGAITARVVRPVTESSLQKIINLIQNAQHLRAPSQRFTDRFGTGYTYAILGMTTAMFFVWWLGFQLPPFQNLSDGSYSAFYRAMTLLVVASPCALVLSIPSAILASIAWSAKKGVLFRGGAAIEKLSEIDTVALDKTGTLTTGELTVHEIESFPPGRELDVAEIAFTMESHSQHPIARAITRYGKARGLKPRDLDEFRSITGQGLRGRVGESVCYLGRRDLMLTEETEGWLRELPEPPVQFSEVWVVHRDLIGRILLKDEIRHESKGVLEKLARDGIKTLMLTGDRRGAAESVASEIGIAEVRAGLHPEDKVAVIEKMVKEGRRVAMVGDGVNDAPSLAAADVSVAMGGKGSDAALEQSDVVLMGDRIEKILTAFQISRSAKAVIWQNLAISLGTVAVMVAFALTGKVPLPVGVIAHEGSTVFVCLNSLRLLFSREVITEGNGKR